MNIPNIDAMSAGELRNFARDCTRLAAYAARMAVAKDLRHGGSITAAKMQEDQCRAIRLALPAEWVW